MYDDEPNVVLSAGPVWSRAADDDDPPYEPPRLVLGFGSSSTSTAPRRDHRILSNQAFEERRCRRICCPVNGPHDRTHPLCIVMPVLWDGDQA